VIDRRIIKHHIRGKGPCFETFEDVLSQLGSSKQTGGRAIQDPFEGTWENHFPLTDNGLRGIEGEGTQVTKMRVLDVLSVLETFCDFC
jgi:hypothetical protein